MCANYFFEGNPPDLHRFRVLEPVRKLQSGPGNLSVAKLRQYYEEAFINLLGGYPPSGRLAGHAPAHALVRYNLPPAVIANVMKAR